VIARHVWVRASQLEQVRGRARLCAEDAEASEIEALWRQWAERCGLAEAVVAAPAPERIECGGELLDLYDEIHADDEGNDDEVSGEPQHALT
jgi:hypothetical protein